MQYSAVKIAFICQITKMTNNIKSYAMEMWVKGWFKSVILLALLTINISIIIFAFSSAAFRKKPLLTGIYWREEVVRAILEGAKREVANKTKYFIENLYLKTTYLDGVNTGKQVYPWGDINPKIGVCTDLIIRALRNAGFDLQQRIYTEMLKDQKLKKIYPWGTWKKQKADKNIDHRRCPNQKTYFMRHSDVYEIKGDAAHISQFQPGDIVYWDLETKPRRFHVGIISDNKNKDGIPLVIHCFPVPGYTAEEDVLFSFKLLYRFRFPPDSEKPPEKDEK